MKKLTFSTDKSRLDIAMITDFLHNQSYWAKERAADVIVKSIENSLCIGAYLEGRQVAFARIVTDYSTMYYLADFFVLPEYQGQGVGEQLMTYVDNIDEFKTIRGYLTTRFAHGFYERHGYTMDSVVVRERIMVKEVKPRQQPPTVKTLEDFEKSLDEFSDDFMIAGRNQTAMQEREE
ncbi:MAG: GNAT family N-acetyltransferase [Spirochaetia bacterium]|jgi:GNAT superfamily N-acetyltransferase|nr:GNAT family N-acetyltransferase [Spirochaetia bacterium]